MIPAATVAAIAQALDTYRLITEPNAQTPAGAAEAAAAGLLSAGWPIRPVDEPTQPPTPPPGSAAPRAQGDTP